MKMNAVPDPTEVNKGLSESSAEQENVAALDTSIRETVGLVNGGFNAGVDTLRGMIAEAKATPNFLNLIPGGKFVGKDWKFWVTDILAGVPDMRAPIREMFNKVLLEAGAKTVRERAEILGVSKSQVQRDDKAAVADLASAIGKAAQKSQRAEDREAWEAEKLAAEAEGRKPRRKPQASHVKSQAKRLLESLESADTTLTDTELAPAVVEKRFPVDDIPRLVSKLAEIQKLLTDRADQLATAARNAAVIEAVTADPGKFVDLIEGAHRKVAARDAAKKRHPSNHSGTQGTVGGVTDAQREAS
jgi:hypothetical protein